LSFFKPIAPTVLALLFIVLFGPGSVRAQGDLRGQSSLVNGTSRDDLSGPGGIKPPMNSSGVGTFRRPTAPRARYASSTQTVLQGRIPVKPKPLTGTLVVVAESGANVLVEPVGGGVAKNGVVPPGERSFIFVDLKPGRYRVEASLDEEHKNDEGEVTVTTKKTEDITLRLPLKTYTVTIKTNVRSGEIRYAPVEGKQDPSTGQIVYTAKPNTTRLATIQSDGTARLPDLPFGTYGVDIRADEVGYQTLLRRFTLPGETTYPVTLEKNLSEGKLSAIGLTFKSNWEVPANWNVSSAGIQVRGRGVAVPRSDSFQHYADFELQSDVRLRNGVGASFIVHRKDDQNYYLVQLTGARASEPYVLRGFIFNNGTRTSFGEPQSIQVFSSTLNSSQPFTVTMKMRGKRLEVWITDNDTGNSEPAGTLTDPNGVNPIGAVGIAASDNEEFDVASVILCKECLK
jgi:hypothetical protein